MNFDKLLLLLCFANIGTWKAICAKKSLNMDPIDMTEWNLPGDTKYPTFHKLSSSDFHHRVMHCRDAWIVLIYKGGIRKKWRRHAESLKASIWYGSIDFDEEEHFVHELVVDIDQYNISSGIALVIPFGGKKKEKIQRKEWPKVATEPEEAERMLRPTFPDITNKFTFARENMEHFQNWIVINYYKSEPPKFPVLCIIDQTETPIQLLALSNYFSNFFGLAIVQKDHLDRLLSLLKQIPYPKVYPHYLLLLGKEPTSEDMDKGKYGITFDIMPFKPQKYGQSNRFLALTKFFFTANEDYRERLLGKRSDEPALLSEMQPIRDALNNRLKDIAEFDYTVKTEL